MVKTTHSSPIEGVTFPEESSDYSPSASEDDDTVLTKEEFFASLKRGEEAYRDGRSVRLRDNETVKQLLQRVRG